MLKSCSVLEINKKIQVVLGSKAGQPNQNGIFALQRLHVGDIVYWLLH